MKIYVRAHDVNGSNPLELAKRVHELGFDGVQLAINKVFKDQSALPNTVTPAFLQDMNQAFTQYGLSIPLLGSYFNPVHSQQDQLKLFMDKFKDHLTFANQLGANYVGSETGSYYSDTQWLYDVRSESEEAYQRVKTVFYELATFAKNTEAKVAIEGARHHCIYEPKRLKRLLDDMPLGTTFAIIDIYNYLSPTAYNQTVQHQLFDEAIDLLKDQIRIFHLKDFVFEDGKLRKVGLGQGIMDLAYMIPRIKKEYPNAILIFEGVEYQDLTSSLSYIKKLLGE